MNNEIALVGLFLVFFWNYIIMYHLTEPKFSRAKTKAIWAGGTAALLLTAYILMYTVGIDMCAPILAVISMVVIIGVLFFVSTDCTPKKIFLVVTYFNYFFLTVQSSFLISQIFFTPVTNEYQILSVVIRNLMNIILVPLYFKFLHPKFRAVKVERNTEWWYLSIISALFSFIFINQAMMVNRIWKLPAEYLPVMLPIFIQGITTCFVMFRTISYMNKTAEAGLMKQNTYFLSEQVERLLRAEEDSRRFRHDLRHHLINIYEYARAGDCETLLLYLDEYDKMLSDTAVKRFCANGTINNILSAYAGEAEKADIEYVCEAKTGAELPIKDTDIVAILANLIENALAGSKASGAESPRTEIFIREENRKLIIVCNNSCSDDFILSDGLPQNRGIGISSIISSCEKYGGMINYAIKDGICSVCAVLEI